MLFKSYKMDYEANVAPEKNRKWKIINLVFKVLSGIAVAFIAYLIYQISVVFF